MIKYDKIINDIFSDDLVLVAMTIYINNQLLLIDKLINSTVSI